MSSERSRKMYRLVKETMLESTRVSSSIGQLGKKKKCLG